jgi:hypothetical protein
MTWGGNRLKQELNLLGPAIFEVNTPPVPCSEKVSRTGDLFIFLYLTWKYLLSSLCWLLNEV